MVIKVSNSAWKQFSKLLLYSPKKYGILFSSYYVGSNKFVYGLSPLNDKKYHNIYKNKKLQILLDPETQTKLFIDPYNNDYVENTLIDFVKDYKDINNERFIFHNSNMDYTLNNSLSGITYGFIN